MDQTSVLDVVAVSKRIRPGVRHQAGPHILRPTAVTGTSLGLPLGSAVTPYEDTPLFTERRSKFRFPLNCELSFRGISLIGVATLQGVGRLVDISSKAVSFRTEMVIPFDVRLQISIPWPACLENGCPLKLVVLGSLLQTRGEIVVVSVEGYEFRTSNRSTTAPQVTEEKREMRPLTEEGSGQHISPQDRYASEYERKDAKAINSKCDDPGVCRRCARWGIPCIHVRVAGKLRSLAREGKSAHSPKRREK